MSCPMTPQQLKEIMTKNPNLKIHSTTGSKQPFELPKEEHRSPKYWNVKQYVYEDGTVAEEKTIKNHGKIVEIYDSRREYFRYFELVLLQKAGKNR